MIQWLKYVSWEHTTDWLKVGWMFSSQHGGSHRVEYGWIMEYRCNCKEYETPPTPKRKLR